MKIYVLHWNELTKRKENILKEFKREDLEGEFIEKYTVQEIHSDEKLSKVFGGMGGTASIFMKQIHALELISKGNNDYALIFEDDVALCDGFKKRLNDYMSQLPEDWDMFFIGDGCNLHIPDEYLKEDTNVYLKGNQDKEFPRSISHLQGGKGATRCLDSYLVKKEVAKNIVEEFKKVANVRNTPCDWWMNNVIRGLNLKVYWCEPTIATQGSQNKKYASSLKNKDDYNN